MNRMEKFCARPASSNSGAERPAVAGASLKLSVATVLDLSAMNLRHDGRGSQVESDTLLSVVLRSSG